ncbi:hypothetical protein AB5J52_00580 [Streptomyces sp. R39]|uniref:Uncharacterized protein n=1 Tax=Streptomyces sp. R39 TaxID=3238631 RepID=A0AB39QCC2_9ACTN
MLADVPLTDDERVAADDGQATLDQLLERLTDVPAAAGPAPRQPGAPATATLLPIGEVRNVPAS